MATYLLVEALNDLVGARELTLSEVSVETRRVYVRGVHQFADWLGEAHPKLREPGSVTTKHVHGWQRSLLDAGRSKATRRVRLIAVRLFFGYLLGEPDTGVSANPAAGIELPTADEHVVDVIHDEDLAALLRALDGRATSTGATPRWSASCSTPAAAAPSWRASTSTTSTCALRRSPCAARRAGAAASCRSAPRPPWRSASTCAPARSARPPDRRPCSSPPAPPAGGTWRITGAGLAEMLTRRCEAVGMPPINPHRFRYTWAHYLLANGANEGDVEKLAGWRSPTMVRRYGASAADQRARDAARRLGRSDRV